MSEWLIKLNGSLFEVASEEVSQSIIKWQIFFILGAFMLSKEYWMVSYESLRPWEFTTNRESKGGSGIFRLKKKNQNNKKSDLYSI